MRSRPRRARQYGIAPERILGRHSSDECTAIRTVVAQRGICDLFHFTRARNLSGILAHGLLARDFLLQSPIPALLNDPERRDGHTDRISLSIGFPNACLFPVYRQRFPEEIWVVLRLDARILWTMDCLFLPTNASSSALRDQAPENFQGDDALVALFSDWSLRERERIDSMKPWWPTDVQAEVMVHRWIPPAFIREVIFEVPSASVPFRPMLSEWPILYSRRYFGKRY